MLQITVDDVIHVEIPQSQNNTRRIKFGLAKQELFELDVQFTVTNVLHAKVYVRLRPKQEWVQQAKITKSPREGCSEHITSHQHIKK
jgi:hypothetical protein